MEDADGSSRPLRLVLEEAPTEVALHVPGDMALRGISRILLNESQQGHAVFYSRDQKEVGER